MFLQESKDDYEAYMQDALDNDAASNFTPEQKQATYTKLHLLIDEQLQQHASKWHRWLQQKDMDRYFKQFSIYVERAALKLAAQPGSQACFKGRGAVNTKQVKEAPRASYCNDMETMVSPLNREGSRLLMQSRRAAAIRENF